MNDLDWEELKLFYVVAKSGSLAGASQQVGVSAPTIGRKIASLEKVIGRKLFMRHQTGYELAADGHTLFEKVRAMDAIAGQVAEWGDGAYQLPNVTISAGTWVSRFLAENLSSLWGPLENFRLCFSTTELQVDLTHKEADIGLRNARPQSGNLAIKRTVTVAFSSYCNRDFDSEKHANWVSLGRENSIAPSHHWVHQQPDLWISMWVSSPTVLLEMLKGGAGRGVLPCFIGDREPSLKRAGPLIKELEHTMWMVMHDDERHQPTKRLVIDRLSNLLKSKESLFAGDDFNE